MIKTPKSQDEDVQVALQARFDLDGPSPVAGVEDGTTFYYLDLYVNSDQPQRIKKVTYLLDEESYWEPKRESTDSKHAFSEQITSYGDFMVRVQADVSGRQIERTGKLSELLEAGHASDSNAYIKKAIENIRNN